jgi:predicted sulfurtransferase
MASNLKEMLAAADAVVPRLTAAEFRNRIGKDDVLVVDLRDGPELAVGGKIADPDSPYYTTRRIAKRCIDANLSTRG